MRQRIQSGQVRLSRSFEQLEARHLLAAQVVVNEIHYNPADYQPSAEFVELYNAGDTAADLSGWRFTDGIEYAFPPRTTLAPNAYAVIAEDPVAYKAAFDVGPFVAYEMEEGTIGRRTFRGAVGMDFVVKKTISIISLGTFDSGSGGIGREATVQLWSRNDGGTPADPSDDRGEQILGEIVFRLNEDGELIGGSRYKPLAEPLELEKGAYSIVTVASGADGRGDRIFDGEEQGAGKVFDGNGRIAFVGNSRSGDNPAQFPIGIGIHPHQFGAGTFLFDFERETPFHSAVGQYSGRLSNSGERITLQSEDGTIVDTVSYKPGFPWPTAPSGGGSSMELIHPLLDNQLAGSWRASFGTGERWSYFKGTAEPSVEPSAWKLPGFDDTAWNGGLAPIGRSTRFPVSTLLDDFQNNYSTVYLRKTFQVDDPSSVENLALRVFFDDGLNVWINGTHVARSNAASSELPFDALAESSHDARDPEDFVVSDPANILVAGQNVIAVQLLNFLISSGDIYFDAELLPPSLSAAGPTPGARNSIFATASGPQLRLVQHTPQQPTSAQDVTVTVMATDPDGVAAVTLEYQIVNPGDYIRKSDSEFATDWKPLPMHDDGTRGDVRAADSVFTAAIPASLHQHRQLVRYRMRAHDTQGDEVAVPYADDPQPNFAYFVYDGIPAWTAADRPGRTPVVVYSTDVTRSVPAFHLISRASDVLDSNYDEQFNTKEFRFEGTLVVGDEVYDHIRYRIRGQWSTYVTGKNKWKLKFNRGHEFQGYDQHGRPWPEKLRTLNFGTNASPWAPGNRGMAGMDEAIAFRLFNMVGVPAPHMSPFQLRIIDAAQEASETNQYEGDLWGLYLAFENPSGDYLRSHGLPDGNLFRMQNTSSELEHLGFGLADDLSDLYTFTSRSTGYNRRPIQPMDWWRDNVDLAGYYSYRSVVEALNHADLRDRENMLLYLNPETEKWSMLPWDVDLLYQEYDPWGPDGLNSKAELEQFRRALLHEKLLIEFQNRARELQDLLLNDEQGWFVIEEYVRYVEAFAAIDRAQWDYHPRASQAPANGAHRGAFYNAENNTDPRKKRPAIHPVGFEGMVNWVKKFISKDGFGGAQLALLAEDPLIPAKPTIVYVGDSYFPADELVFQTSDFEDGEDAFDGMEWRIGRVFNPTVPSNDVTQPWIYEIDSVWTSGELDSFQRNITVPSADVTVGHTYRARVRHKDTSGRWSHWSEPVQFTVGLPRDTSRRLTISEIQFNPSNPSPEEFAAGFTDNDDFEFLEMVNIGDRSLDLSGVRLEKVITAGDDEGLIFDFSEGAVQQLAPGARVLVVEDVPAFQFRYGMELPVAGQWSGQLSNRSERITLVADGAVVLQFTYSDGWYPETDGGGPSLEIVDVDNSDLDRWNRQDGWRPSAQSGGTPGTSNVLRADFDGNQRIDQADIDRLFGEIRAISEDCTFDLNGDRQVTSADADVLVRDILSTNYGDSDLDGDVDEDDFRQLAGNFGHPLGGWAEGDFDGDGDVDFHDFSLLSRGFTA